MCKMDEKRILNNDQINDMLADVHALYIAALAKYEKARAAERELRRRILEMYEGKEGHESNPTNQQSN